MITQKELCGDNFSITVLAVLTRDYKAEMLDYILPKGLIVEVEIFNNVDGSLYVDDTLVDFNFPLEAAELLDDNSRTD